MFLGEKCFLALCTLVGLLTRVHSVMFNEQVPVIERFPTLFTFIGLLARMSFLMCSKSRLAVECFVTLLTFIGLLIGGNSLV